MQQEKSAKVSEAAKVGDQHKWTVKQLQRRNIYLRRKEAMLKGIVGLGATFACLQADDRVGSAQQTCPTSAASNPKRADSVGVDDRSRKQCATMASERTYFPEMRLEKSEKVSEAAKVGDQHKWTARQLERRNRYLRQKEAILKGGIGLGATAACLQAADDCVGSVQRSCPTSAASYLKVADSVGTDDHSHRKQCATKASDGTSFPAADNGVKMPQQLCPTSAASDLKVADSVGVGELSHINQSVPAQTNENASFSEMSDAGISGRGTSSRKRKSPEDRATEQSDQIEHSRIIDKETQVCKILENLSNLIQKTESDDSEIAWKVRRKRSKTGLRPSRRNLRRLEKRVKVAYGNPSPMSPLYICESVSNNKSQGLCKKVPKKKLIEELIKRINP